MNLLELNYLACACSLAFGMLFGIGIYYYLDKMEKNNNE